MSYTQVTNVQTGETTQIPLTAEQIAKRQNWQENVKPALLLNNFKEERNRRLAETDWWANSDVTMTEEQRAYRQALRDLPANTADVENPVWPVKPGGDS